MVGLLQRELSRVMRGEVCREQREDDAVDASVADLHVRPEDALFHVAAPQCHSPRFLVRRLSEEREPGEPEVSERPPRDELDRAGREPLPPCLREEPVADAPPLGVHEVPERPPRRTPGQASASSQIEKVARVPSAQRDKSRSSTSRADSKGPIHRTTSGSVMPRPIAGRSSSRGGRRVTTPSLRGRSGTGSSTTQGYGRRSERALGAADLSPNEGGAGGGSAGPS